MGDAFGDVGYRGVDLGLEARYVQFRGGQQRAQLVVQLACQVRSLILAHLLQMGGQLGEGRCAVANDFLQTIAFIALNLLLALM